MIQTYERVRETVHSHTLANGLRICYIPKPGFSRTFAMMAANFGSVDACFTMADGTRVQTPAGVAHFLEHKMFEDADGNALQKFAAAGASPNAFTSHNMTAYHFSCTDAFESNLELLVKLVFTPYFTDENVEKEKGIIGQEIRMMEDNPFWQSYVGMYAGLYHTHPVRVSIAGSVESIAPIDPALLLQCHKTFYNPANMTLVVCGTADFDAIVSIAERHSPRQSARLAARDYGVRQDTVCSREVVRRMAVSQPSFMIGFKDAPLAAGESRLRRQLLGDLCARILAGETAPLYAELYQQRLISRKFSADYNLHPEAACAVIAGNSRDPRALRDRLQAAVRCLAGEGVDDALFARMKKAAYGVTLRIFDQPDSLCRAQCEALFGGEEFPAFAEIFDTITAADVRAAFARWAGDDRCTLSIIEPL